MALIQSTAIPSGATDYEIEQSLRFEDGSGAYLSRTPASAGNRKTWTWSGWVKRGNLGTYQTIFAVDNGSTEIAECYWDGSDNSIFWHLGGGSNYRFYTNAIYRDSSSWYHIICSLDTTISSPSGNDTRMKLYVNGEQVTSFRSNATPSLNYEGLVNLDTQHEIGERNGTNNPLDGYLAEVNFIDGQALTPSSFGETGTYGEWKPIEYSGTYGTNGFYLSFATSGLLAATGGTVTTDGDYKVHTFTSSGTFTPDISGEVDYLVIAGGGGGGNGTSLGGGGGGGGAGGYKTGTADVTAQAYSITVGAGGTGGISGGSAPTVGVNSIFSSFTATGGGKGGSYNSSSYVAGGNGGSGGGGGGNTPYTASGSGTVGQGNNGGVGLNSTGNGGGGGGASTVGASGTPVGGVGGAGLSSSITGSAVTRAGGGGGGGWVSSAGGAAGTGGGAGGAAGANSGAAGTANTGGGGGGSGANLSTQGNGGAGGSGIVIIRYKFQ
jgi:hypothetical protein